MNTTEELIAESVAEIAALVVRDNDGPRFLLEQLASHDLDLGVLSGVDDLKTEVNRRGDRITELEGILECLADAKKALEEYTPFDAEM